MFDEQGRLRKVNELPPETASAIASWDVGKKNFTAGRGTAEIHIRFWNKVRALELLGRHLGLFTRRVEPAGELIIRWFDPTRLTDDQREHSRALPPAWGGGGRNTGESR